MKQIPNVGAKQIPIPILSHDTYRPEVDGLRAVAVLSVVLFHAGVTWTAGGYVGVDVFFVISGYFISVIIFGKLDAGTFSFRDFYERRARRILPALLLVITATSIFALLSMPPDMLKDYAQSVVATLLFSSNILFFLESGYWDQTSEMKPLLHTWSLAIEEQFYIVFPLIVLLLWRKRPAFIAILAVVFALSLGGSHVLTDRYPEANFYLAPTRVWELVLGILITLYVRAGGPRPTGLLADALSLLGVTLILYAVVGFDGTTPFPSFYALVPTTGAGLVLLCGQRSRAAAVVLANPLMVWVGLISYSLYLWHQPLFALARLRSLAEPGPAELLPLALLAGGMAFLSWKYVETPMRQRTAVPLRRAMFLIAIPFATLGAAFLSLSLGATAHKAFDNIQARFGDPDRLVVDRTKEVQLVRSYDAGYEKDVAGHFAEDSLLHVVVVGDSQSRNWMRAFHSRPEEFAGTMDLKWIFLDNACLGAFAGQAPAVEGKECERRKDAFLKSDVLRSADLVVVINRWTGEYLRHIPSFMDVLRPFGKTVIFVGSARFQDAVKIAWRLGSAARSNAAERARLFYKLRAADSLRANVELERIAGEAGAFYADEYAFYCDDVARKCTLMEGEDTMLMFDTDHVTVEGARYLAPRVRQLLNQLGQPKGLRSAAVR